MAMSSQLRLIAAAITTTVAALAMGQASAQGYSNSDYGHGNGNGYGHSRTVRCESTNSRRTFCRVDTRGNVRIARQFSQRPCIEGRSWGSSDRGIWVSNGCRADFAIRSGHDHGRDYGDNHDHNDYNDHNGYSDRNVNTNTQVVTTTTSQVVQCDSTGDGRTYCHSEPNRRFLLGRSRGGNCVEGQTWGMDDRGLWVSGGCRGDFNYQH
jgi:hypothetical protein